MEHEESASLISGLSNIVNNELINDIEIYVGREHTKFYASSFMLAARSPIFFRFFFGDSTTPPKNLMLEDANPDQFLSFLNFVYSGMVTITPQVNWNVFLNSKIFDQLIFYVFLECF